MITRQDLAIYIREAITENGGQATHIEIAKYIWDHHETELRNSGDLLYRWQYYTRWAIAHLRKSGVLMNLKNSTGRGALIGFRESGA